MKQDKQHQEERELTPLEMLLEIMDEENLLRFRRRFEKRGNDRMVDMLSVEIRKREEEQEQIMTETELVLWPKHENDSV